MIRSLLRRVACVATLVTLNALFDVRVLAQQSTETVGMHATPAPGKVVIDGKLDDWDLSGARLMCYDVVALKDRLSGTVAFMWDADYYYVSIHWRDPSPMVNGFDPLIDYGNSWKGDCVQLRIKTDRIAHVTAWYHAKTQRPGMTIHYGSFEKTDPDFSDLNDAMAAGAKQAFTLDADGPSTGSGQAKGYIQEMAIPWKLLTRKGNALAAGDAMQCGVELLYGKPSGVDFPDHRYADNVSPQAKSGAIFFWVGDAAWGTVSLEKEGNLKLPPQTFKGEVAVKESQGPIAISYQLEKPGYVSLVIDNEQGVRVRNLLKEVFKDKGALTARWDGADDAGNGVPAGNYRWKAIMRDDLHINYVTHFNNPGNPPWDNLELTGAWTSDHIESYDLAGDDTRVYVGSPVVEAGWSPVALDMEFKKCWGRKLWTAAQAAEAGILYVVADLAHHKKGDKASVHVDRLDAQTGNYLPFDNQELPMGGARLPVIEYIQPEENNPHEGYDGGRLNVQGAAVRGQHLAISLQLENRIALFDSKTGKSLGSVDVPSPAGLAFDPKGGLLAVSGQQMVKIDLTTKQVTPFITDHLDTPKRIAVAKDGRIAVSNWGKLQNVSLFDAAGKYLSSIGITGGRTIRGDYNPLGFARPMGLAIDPENRLWVSEYFAAPRRISRWKLDGTHLDERIGPAYYSGGGLIDPEEATRVYYDDIEFEVDYAKPGAAKVKRIASGHLGPQAIPMHMGVGTADHLIRHQGQTYHVNSKQMGTLIMKKQPDGTFLPSAAFTWDAFGRSHQMPVEGLLSNKRYQWADRNGDGLAQKEEMTITDLPAGVSREAPNGYWGNGVGQDLSVYLAILQYGLDNRSKPAQLWKFPVKEWTACGAPVYDMANPVVLVKELPGGDPAAVATLKDGSVVVNTAPDFLCYDANGNLKWTYPNTDANAPTAGPLRPGVFIGPQKFTGIGDYGREIGEVLMVNGYNGSRFLITADGLWIGHVLNDCRNSPEPMPETAIPGFNMDNISGGGESFSGAFTRTKDGRSLLMWGATECRASGITGIESIQRLQGALSVEPALAKEAADFRAKELEKEREAKVKANADNVLRIVGGAAPAIDGDLADWKGDAAIQWDAGGNRVIKAMARRDEANLYLAYEVPDTTPMINNGPDYQLLFTTGDCLDFWLRTDPKTDAKQPAQGDVRLMLSVYKGKPVAVLFEQKAAQKKQPFGFSSPAETVPFDRVEILPGAKVVFKWTLLGYTCEAAIPLTEIGLTLPAGETIGDAGVCFSDVNGNASVQRSCWSNKETGNTDDYPAESRLMPAKWGKVVMP
jgi:hypothetical protein